MMKTMKYILLILLLNYSVILGATTYQLHQTSSATLHSRGASATTSAGTGYGSMQSSASNVTLGAVTSVAVPAVNFQSTSVMHKSGSTLPNAAADGVVIANDVPNNNQPAGPKRVGPDTPPADPYDGPLGDTPWLLMLLLALGYALRVGKKYGHRLPDTGK